jgi:serine phosphatase RsbU (regulator of sigma subunit)
MRFYRIIFALLLALALCFIKTEVTAKQILTGLINDIKNAKTDSERAKYLCLLSENLNQSNADTIEPYLFKFEKIVQKENYKEYFVPLSFAKAEMLFYNGKYDESLLLLKSILPASNLKYQALINNQIGEVLMLQTKYSDAIDILLKNERLSIKINDRKSLTLTYNLLGMMNHRLHRLNRALQFFNLCIKHAETTKNYRMLASACENISVIYTEMNDKTNCMQFLLRSIYYRKQINDKNGLASSYNNLSVNYFLLGKLKEAELFGLISLSLSKEIGYSELYPLCYENLGEIYLHNKNYVKAKAYLDTSIIEAIKLKDNRALETSYQIRTSLDTLTQNYRLGLYDYITFKRYTDSIMDKENSQKLVEADLKSDFEKRKEIMRVKANSELAIQKFIRNVLLFIVLIAFVFAFILYKQRNKISLQKQEVELQRNIVAEKSKEVFDSITYAKKIQQAILPSDKTMRQMMNNIFCLYLPKDIVAGDFYWMEKKDNYIYLASCDCTGHGVPGAMVSVVCNSALNRSLNEFNESDTNKILDRTRLLVIENFSKSESAVMDGMDISLARINTKTNELMWSGAYIPLWIVRNYSFIFLNPDKQPIGTFENANPFTAHTLQLEKNDTLYLFSDGYSDQFGGEYDKKFSKAKLRDLLLECSALPTDSQYQLLLKSHLDWKGQQEQIDDITIIGVII